ncbi:hypothetical protein TRE132_31020 [Pseudomonas chlororaphis subsp. aurantiaca]|uniref:PoNe immunity protein domain-containing protein n=1 Tax=Pseudomonas chlororaphis TaxID=587753 RepID=UPI000865A542|nr:PoNe immunity protein domain-containing protein [Pseudomonas chlororaphis]BAV75087.1 hypothetical protein PCAU_2878 [Pseudomonas chlororaphis subsp. aurantiaca]BBN54977.1 hypothetical protein TRE132_31020 [Pseudomonas chlororaphis subsp. aurantiaca]
MTKRQKFLSDNQYKIFLKESDEVTKFFESNRFKSETDEEEKSLRARHFQRLTLDKLFITYTAGQPIEALLPILEEVIEGYETWQRALALHEGIINISPLAIDDWSYQYEECVQVISLCILLHRKDLLKRFVALIDQAGYAGDDTLYEDLLRKVLPERHDVDQWYHDSYTLLVRAIYASSQKEASELLKNYCKDWYSEFEQAPWHDSHLQGDEGSYVGYWAFEAAAVAFLYDIDDSQVDNPVYPKDLTEYARNYKSLNSPQVNRIESGKPCSKSGYWFTPAQPNSRRYFNQGEIMPSFSDSNWGDTLWYWSGEK